MEEQVEYADDPTIEDDDALWRRLIRDWVIKDENSGEWRPSSAAFDNSKDGSPLSVVLANIITAMQGNPADVLKNVDDSLCSFTAGLARMLEQNVTSWPKIEDDPAHGWVAGKKTRHVKRQLAKNAQFVILNNA